MYPIWTTIKIDNYFRPRVVVDVIFDVDMRSPIYFCKNLLLLSNLSCSSLTASILWKIRRSDSCNALACLEQILLVDYPRADRKTTRASLGEGTDLWSYSLASRPMISKSRLVLRGLIDRTSLGANRVSTGPESDESRESRETMIVPLLFRLWNFGRRGTGSCRSLSSSEDPDDESDRVGGAGLVKMASSLIAR